MPEHSDVHADKPGKCPKCGMTLIPVMEPPPIDESAPAKSDSRPHQPVAKQLYTCPMHPDVISDKPGKCPKCGMDLVPCGQPRNNREILMLKRIIDFSLKNKFIVLLATMALVLGGVYAVRTSRWTPSPTCPTCR